MGGVSIHSLSFRMQKNIITEKESVNQLVDLLIAHFFRFARARDLFINTNDPDNDRSSPGDRSH
jgi:hypothetical protein